ncbi:hypothetical protein ACLB1G_26160 [Oxalobacteraceae bacterium A2-2]
MKRKLWFIPIALAAIAILGAIVMQLWNWVVPALFAGASPLDYWRALGLLVLCRILFGGFKGRGGHRDWQRWNALTPEEREQFRSRWRGRFHPSKEQPHV